MTEPFWTTERVEELKTRWLNWETFGEIARALGHRSRNAIIGKAHRLGLKRERVIDERPVRPQAHPRLRRRRNGHQFKGGETMSDDTPPGDFLNPKPFIELEPNECRWPGAGEVGPALLWCGAPTWRGFPYCLAHCRLAYVKPGPRPKVP